MQTNMAALRGTKRSFLSDSLIGSFLQRLAFPLVSEFFILISVFLLWYEGLFAKLGWGVLNNSFIVPVLLGLALLFTDKSRIRINRLATYLVLFFVFALVSGVFAASRSINPKLIILGWLLFSQFLIVILASNGVAKPERLIKNIIFVSLPMVLVGGYQFVTKQATSPLWITPAEASISTRAFAFFGSPNVLGAVLAIIIFVAVSLYFKNKDKLMLAISVLTVLVLGFTFSRSAWLGFCAGVAIIIFLKNWKLVYFTPFTAVILLFKQVRDRLAVVFSPSYWFDSSLDGRFWSLNNGFHIWSKYPLLGTGPGTYGGKLALNFASPVYNDGIQNGYVALYFTDNQWLQLLVQTGIIGLILFALFSVNVFFELVNKYNKSRDYVPLGIAGAFVAFCVAGLFGNVLEFGAIAIPMGIMLGVAQSE